jgi:CheY-like chemotaxis protein/HPt (histidine-containing phosphotransfer) domain-containing protein
LLRLISEALAAREANAPASVLAEAVAPAPPDTPIRDAEHQAAAAAGGTAHSRILIVEDSRDNRILLQAYLQGCPYDLTFEENGQAGVERFASGHFDLILMDVQMPVMDGLTATRQIRALERERGSSPVVVIALTANAGSESVETSMNAGCTGHLAKPVSKPELLGALERHARRKPSGPAKPLGKAVRADGIAAMVPAFLARRSKEIPEMLKFLDEGDFARVAVLAHNVKGIGKGYGFPELSVMGAACEQAAKEKNGEAARAKILEMNSYLESGPRERAAFC